jgi:Phage portal protein
MSNRFIEAFNALRGKVNLETRSAQEVNEAGAHNLFGTLGTQNLGALGQYGFIPIDGQGATLNLTDNIDAQWLGLASKNMQYWAYNYCSPLAAVIDKLAEADTNGRIEFLNPDGTTKSNFSGNPRLKRISTLLKRPNPLQTWEEFNSQQVVLCKIFGYCPVFAVCPAGFDKSYSSSLWNLNPFYCYPQRNMSFDMESKSKDNSIISFWQLSIWGKSYQIPNSDILLIKDGYIDSTTTNMGLPISKVAGLDYFVSNICAAMEADNVLLKKKGPLGVFSYDAKPDMAGLLPMPPKDKDALQNDLARYGLTSGQLQYVISKSPIKWNAMSFNLRDLMTKETVRQGVDGICDRFGYPPELMSGKNATYENRNSAEKFLYQNNVIPFSLRRMARYSQFFELDEVSLNLDYDHLPVLQEDIMHAGQARKAKSEGLTLDWQNGLITWNEYRFLQDLDMVAGMDIYYNEYLAKYPPPVQKTKNESITP